MTKTTSGANRYQLISGWVDAAQVNGANGVGSVQFNPFGAAYNLRDLGSMNRDAVVFGGGLAETRSGVQRTGSAALDGYATRGQDLYAQSCFVAGTPILTELGAKAVELIRAGDRVRSRDENDPAGPIELKVVEEVFVRHSLVWEVVADGRVIGTTGEHPFHTVDRGWVPANLLRVGDRVTCRDGLAVTVEAVRDTGRYATVYNFRVADWHTYFVGCDEWGACIWSHNMYDLDSIVKCSTIEGYSETIKFADLSAESQQAAIALEGGPGSRASYLSGEDGIQNPLSKNDLIALSKFFDNEIGIFVNIDSGNMFVMRGGRSGMVEDSWSVDTEFVLVHTHPTYYSQKEHFLTDLYRRSNENVVHGKMNGILTGRPDNVDAELVVDWSGKVSSVTGDDGVKLGQVLSATFADDGKFVGHSKEAIEEWRHAYRNT